jgi:hypothetical protein
LQFLKLHHCRASCELLAWYSPYSNFLCERCRKEEDGNIRMEAPSCYLYLSAYHVSTCLPMRTLYTCFKSKFRHSNATIHFAALLQLPKALSPLGQRRTR